MGKLFVMHLNAGRMLFFSRLSLRVDNQDKLNFDLDSWLCACSGEPGELQDRAVHDADQDQGEDAEGERAALRPIICKILRARSAGER